VVTTVSPLWLHHADDVVLLSGDRVMARGRHEDLLADDAAYRAVVARTFEEPSGEPDLEDSRV
jgi:ABC-type cobalamin transport system ATPase subunit